MKIKTVFFTLLIALSGSAFASQQANPAQAQQHASARLSDLKQAIRNEGLQLSEGDKARLLACTETVQRTNKLQDLQTLVDETEHAVANARIDKAGEVLEGTAYAQHKKLGLLD